MREPTKPNPILANKVKMRETVAVTNTDLRSLFEAVDNLKLIQQERELDQLDLDLFYSIVEVLKIRYERMC